MELRYTDGNYIKSNSFSMWWSCLSNAEVINLSSDPRALALGAQTMIRQFDVADGLPRHECV